MNCSELRQKLLDNLVPIDEISSDPQVLSHLESCTLCQHFCQDYQLDEMLRKIVVPPPSPGFVERSIAVAIAQNAPTTSHHLLTAAAAVVILTLTFGLIYNQDIDQADITQTQQHRMKMAVNQTKNIHVVIESNTYQANATIKVSWAENLFLQGYESIHELNWQTELLEGKNVIKLPLILQGDAGGYVDISYESGIDAGSVRVVVSKV
ncbi:MAG: hypothetical protein K9K86_09920 [Pseudomonadales bacterium]|nr:hypothetical protein [Pseudomonadales bacterium]